MCPAFIKSEPGISVVAIGGGETDYSALRQMFREANWSFIETTNAKEALAILQERQIPVVLMDREAPGGNWKDVLKSLRNLKRTPALIVTAKFADEYLWAEVLNVGGYDVLVQPFDEEEVTRVFRAAVRHFTNESERARKTEAKLRPLVFSAAS